MSLEKMVKQMVETMNMPKGTEPYDTTAEVVRVDGDTVWVHIAGGVDETPVKKTINAVKGDRVQIRVGGGTAWIVGNESKPPTDDRVANVAKKTAENADLKAILAKKTADDASKVATNYIDFTEEDGLTVGHKNLESKVNISGGGVKLYDEEGKVGTEIKSGEVDIGTEDTNRIVLNEDGIVFSSKDDISTFTTGISSNLAYIDVFENATEDIHTISKTPIGGVVVIGIREGVGIQKTATFTYGTAGTSQGITYDGDKTFSGFDTWASPYIFIKNIIAYTTNDYPPYITFGTRDNNSDIGAYSATIGLGLSASKTQTVVGECNVEDTGNNHLFIVGGGSSSLIDPVKINALAVGRDLHTRVRGDVYVGCNADSTGGRKLVSASADSGSGTKSNVATGTTLKNLTTVSLPNAGVYMLLGLARFPANANGRRGLAWGSTATGYFDNSLVVVPPVTESNGITRIQSMAIVTVTSAPLDVYLNCYHTAGTQLNVDYYWRYIKLA